MAATSEQSRYAQSVMSFMELCADIHPCLRKTIAKSKVFHTFVLELAQEGSAENVAMLRKSHEKCAAAYTQVLEEKRAEVKRKLSKEFLTVSKRTKLSHPSDEDLQETLKAKAHIIFERSSPANEHSTGHAAEKGTPSSTTNSNDSSDIPDPKASLIQSACSRATTQQDEVHIGTLDTENIYESSKSSGSDTIAVETPPLAAIQEEGSYASPPAGLVETAAHIVQPLTSVQRPEDKSVTSASIITPSDDYASTQIAENMGQTAISYGAANDKIVTDDARLISDLERRNAKEIGITMGSPAVLALIRVDCLSWQGWHDYKHRKSNLDDIFNICTRFNFDIVKHKLLRYLTSRPAPTSSDTPATPIPSTWNMSKTVDIVNALHIIGSNDKHAKIHRAYAQMKLFAMVNANTTSAIVVKGTGKHISERLIYLEVLARREAATDSMQESMEKQYVAAYSAGKRWSELVEWFGGIGSILIIVTLDIGSSYVESGWNEFQRACFEHIAEDLWSIKKLVKKMGDGVLEQYCRFGNLTDDLRDEIRRVEGYC